MLNRCLGLTGGAWRCRCMDVHGDGDAWRCMELPLTPLKTKSTIEVVQRRDGAGAEMVQQR